MQSSSEYDVLLLYPFNRNAFFDAMIPLGLASIGGMVERAGYRVRAIDFNTFTGDFQGELRSARPRIVGIGGTTPSRKESFRLARNVKALLPGTAVVYGGPHATFTAEDTIRHVPEIDYIIRGEGEYSFLALCEQIVRGASEKPIPGLCRRSNGGVVGSEEVRIDDLDALPMAARHLFPPTQMKLDLWGFDADFLLTSRGCPVNCTFCSASRMFPGGVRLRGMESVQAEVETILSRKNIKALKIFDSTFTANRAHVEAFCAMIRPYGLFWECEVRADTVDRDLLALMHDAGCRYIDLGLESSVDRVISSVAKKITVAQADRVLSWARELSIETKLFMIFGHLGETYAECREDVGYVRRHRKEITIFANTIGIRVYPGTSLEKKARSLGIIPKESSWATYEPPRKQLLLLEMDDVMILDQKELSFFKLILIGMMLNLQLTTISYHHLGGFVGSVATGLAGRLKRWISGGGRRAGSSGESVS